MTTLKVIERTAVLVAALAALVPLWQFYDEAEDRKVDRAANFILAYSICAEKGISTRSEVEPAPEPATTFFLSTAMKECDFINEFNRSEADYIDWMNAF